MSTFRLGIDYQPRGDQGTAIDTLIRGLKDGEQHQVLLGVTGSGKTFTMAKVIEKLNRPALVLAHNKTLAAQLYQEFKCYFPSTTSTSKKKPPLTTSWTSCVFRPPARCSSGAIA